ncbi:MAG: hypothetical protein KY454_00480 [Actinobacteria bacterium]|nr:hypothetical protein [Actinomycetota bacterium]MBW3650485.1 hypothetical protein [Actinomycetota bacterium]
MSEDPGHLQCPFCNSYDVNRLFLGGLNVDTCDCSSCGARWDQDSHSGEYRTRGRCSSVLFPRSQR